MADHFVILQIINKTDIEFTSVSEWFDSGHTGEREDTGIPKQGVVTIRFYPDGGAGVSGFLTWWTDNEMEVCIAFSNPVAGHNKLDIGVIDSGYALKEEKNLWDNMDYHDYQSFDRDLDIPGLAKVTAHCRCTGGGTNNATITLDYKS
ncbi:MAG: hypothetical protein KZQ84_16475 [Candidatus Thiodiazotropha sp. (ex Lucinoma borealis)]|nr:hypothetical protein [Candidatus Thiodiazotropha sp. (ex Lucinoma borealis)]